MKNLIRIIAIFLILTMCVPFVFSCGVKEDTGSGDANPEEETSAPTDPPTEPEPTEPTTAKPTEPPTEPPTDPAELPEAVIIGDYQIIPGARYYLWSPNSNLYLTVDGDYKYAGFTQEDYTGNPDQMFVFEVFREEVGDTSTKIIYKIRALGTKEGYLDLDDPDELKDGMVVTCTAQPNGENSQEWLLKAQKKTKLTDADDNKIILDEFEDVNLPLFAVTSNIPKNTGRCLDVSGISKNSGGTIHLWSGGTANNQKWFFELVSDVESGKIVPRGLQE